MMSLKMLRSATKLGQFSTLERTHFVSSEQEKMPDS